MINKLIIISSSSNSLINFRYDLLKYLSIKGISIHAFGPNKSNYVEEELSRINIQFHQYPLERTGFNPLKDLKTVQFLREKFKEIKPDVILPYTVKPVVYANIAKRGLGIKSVSWITGIGFYGLPSQSIKDKFAKAVMTNLYNLGKEKKDIFVFQNNDDVKFFQQKGILKKKEAYKITPGSGINLEKFPFSEPVIKPIQFIYVGRLIKAKGIQNFVEAAEQIKAKYKETKFIALGGIDQNNPNAISETEMKRLQDKGIVHFTGRVNNVIDYVKASSVFVLPSMYREGIPRSILEALSIGRAIITTDNVGCRETVEKGFNGILVEKNNTPELVEAMEFFCESPNKINEYGKNSRQLAEEKFNVEIVNKIMFKSIQEN